MKSSPDRLIHCGYAGFRLWALKLPDDDVVPTPGAMPTLVVGMLVVNSERAGVPSKDMQEIRYTRTWVSGLLQSHAHASVGMAPGIPQA
jgi:hypothetical protein